MNQTPNAMALEQVIDFLRETFNKLRAQDLLEWPDPPPLQQTRVAAAQPAVTLLAPPPTRATLLGKGDCRPLGLGVKFNGDVKQLAFFLTQVWNYMEEYGPDLQNDLARV